MTVGGQLDADRVRALFTELSDRLAAADVTAQLFVVGGAAMALAYDRDRLTRDVDALFVPAPEVRQIAEEMSGGLLVQIPSPEYLLATKLHASRDDRDLDDAAILCDTLGYTSAQGCIDLLTDTYPIGQLLPRHRYLAEEVATRARALHDRAANYPATDVGEAVRRRERRINDGFDPLSDPFGTPRGHGLDPPEPPGRGL